MVLNYRKIIVLSSVLVFLTGSVFGQINYWERSRALDQILLKKDLHQAIREAESAPAGNVAALLWRLNLYERAANVQKVIQTIRQIPNAPDFEKNRYEVSSGLRGTVVNDLFENTEILRFFLQNFGLDDEVYGKFIEKCKAGLCDVNAFDAWLEKKGRESVSEKEHWFGIRISWREQFGLDNSALLNRFVEDVRQDPANLDKALEYLRYFRTVREIAWLTEVFESEQAYDYYALGSFLNRGSGLINPDNYDEMERRRIAVRLLQKSLALPFTDQDKKLIQTREFRMASIPPVIGDYEKQLRYWTKTALAETYLRLNESANAQPFVEQIALLDTRDIVVGNPNFLAGAVQADSGARFVESKILSDQSTRQTSFVYWTERVSYYRGRGETERIFDAFREGLRSVPFNLNDPASSGARLNFIWNFADFAGRELQPAGDQATRYGIETLNDEAKRKAQLWNDAEDFLRNEFERTKSNLNYSYELSNKLEIEEFDDLLIELLKNNTDLLIKFYSSIPELDSDILELFLNSEEVEAGMKDAVVSEILPLAEHAPLKRAWVICQHILSGGYAIRVLPILQKNLKRAETMLSAPGIGEYESDDLNDMRFRNIEALFRAYIDLNDWPAAEKLMLEKYHTDVKYRLDSLILCAARSGAEADALRLWKLKANLNRRDLDNLSSMMRYPQIVSNLRSYYEKMKKDEPYSPIPERALKILSQ